MKFVGQGSLVPILVCGVAIFGCGSRGHDEPMSSAPTAGGWQATNKKNSTAAKQGCFQAVVRKNGTAGRVEIRVKCETAGSTKKPVEFGIGATDLRHRREARVLNFEKRIRPTGDPGAGSAVCRREKRGEIFCSGRASGAVAFIENVRLDPANVCQTDFWITVDASRPCHGICNADLTIQILSRGRPKGCG